MVRADNQAYYDAFSETYDSRRQSGYHRLIDDQAAELVRRVGEGQHVLEVGCGTGLILERIARFAGRAEGVDISPRMLGKALERGLSAQLADVSSLPFEDESFDVVCSFKVLAHVRDWEVALKEMMRVLRPNGHLIVDVYNRNSLRFMLKRLLGPRKTSKRFDEGAIVTRFWSLEEARARLPREATLCSVSGIRLLTLIPALHRIPGAGWILERLEWLLMDSPMARYAGFVVLTVQKRDGGRRRSPE